MLLRNSFYLFFIPMWLFLYHINSIYTENWHEKYDEEQQQTLDINQLQDLNVLDTFQIEKENTIYYYKVLEKFYVKDLNDVHVEEPKVLFSTTVDHSIHLVVKAIHTGKLVKN